MSTGSRDQYSDHDILIRIQTLVEENARSFREFKESNALDHIRIEAVAQAAHKRIDERDKTFSATARNLVITMALGIGGWGLIRLFTNSVHIGI